MKRRNSGNKEENETQKYRGAEDMELYGTCRIYGKGMYIPVVSGAAGYGKAGFGEKRGLFGYVVSRYVGRELRQWESKKRLMPGK